MKMSGLVTGGAEGDQILVGIVTQLAARLDVVHLQVLRSTTVLASPPVAREHFASELAVRIGFKP